MTEAQKAAKLEPVYKLWQRNLAWMAEHGCTWLEWQKKESEKPNETLANDRVAVAPVASR